MLYREAGQFKTPMQADQRSSRSARTASRSRLVVLFAFLVVPLSATPYLLTAILIPFLILSLAAFGLNILTGYAGQLSLGTAAFMAVGAFAAYNLMLRVPGMPVLVAFVGSRAHRGAGRRPVRPAQPAHQGLLSRGGDARRAVLHPVVRRPIRLVHELQLVGRDLRADRSSIFGYTFDTPAAKYLLVLAIVALMALAAKNMVRGYDRPRRGWRCATWTSPPR